MLKMRKMKDSGIEWIGEIPEGWEIVPVRSCFDEVRTKNTDGQEQNALQFKSGNIISKTNFNASMDDYVADTITNYTVVLPDTVMINGLNLNYDFKSLRVALVKEKGVITSAYLAIFPDRKKISPQYATYLFKGYETKMAFHNMGAGIRKTLGYKEFKNQPLLLPSEKEQNKISAYLDSKCSHIDIMLSKIRSSIEEYKKLKQAVITQAVTKGVRGEREMKDSGNPWFGQIPTDWKLSRVGLHFSIILGKMLCNAPLNDTYTLEPYYCAADVHFDGVADGERKKMWFSPIEKDLYRVSVGDLLVVEGGAGAGGSAIVENQDSYTYIQNSIMIVRSKGNTDNRYLRYLLEFLVKQGYIDIVCNKATIPHFTKDKLSCVPFCLCPAGEQKEIADYLDSKCAEIDGLIAKKEQLVKELESYKKSLIYEVVTGKREV